jgi:DNA segregation ATPase FtsK/SpoIIIE-like protein
LGNVLVAALMQATGTTFLGFKDASKYLSHHLEVLFPQCKRQSSWKGWHKVINQWMQNVRGGVYKNWILPLEECTAFQELRHFHPEYQTVGNVDDMFSTEVTAWEKSILAEVKGGQGVFKKNIKHMLILLEELAKENVFYEKTQDLLKLLQDGLNSKDLFGNHRMPVHGVPLTAQTPKPPTVKAAEPTPAAGTAMKQPTVAQMMENIAKQSQTQERRSAPIPTGSAATNGGKRAAEEPAATHGGKRAAEEPAATNGGKKKEKTAKNGKKKTKTLSTEEEAKIEDEKKKKADEKQEKQRSKEAAKKTKAERESLGDSMCPAGYAQVNSTRSM